MDIEDEQQKRQNITKHNAEQTSRLRRAWLLIIVPVLLALLIASGFIGYHNVYLPYALHAQQTALVQTQRAAIAGATATSAAIAGATATAQIAATATILAAHQQTYNQVTSTVPVLDDELHAPDEYDWDTGAGCSFKHQMYTISVTQKGFFLPCLAKKTSFSNFAYQVDMRITTGDAGGLIVRANAKSTQSYLFVVGLDGTYSIYYYPGDPKQRAQTLAEGYSDRIQTGANQDNILGVVASGTSLDFYINKKYITSVIDERRSSGLIGLLANNYTHTTEVVYTHVQVWKL
jgi:hypothetical protein